MNKNVNYGNWVPEKMLALCYVAAAVLGIAAYVTGPVLHLAIPTWILGILAAICLVYGIYMHICHELFAFGKGNMMAKVHQHLVDHLEWDGEGTLLDIGCGAAALTIRCAKAFPKAKLVGMDYWGAEWNYAKEQCEANAKAEGVADRITFTKEMPPIWKIRMRPSMPLSATLSSTKSVPPRINGMWSEKLCA